MDFSFIKLISYFSLSLGWGTFIFQFLINPQNTGKGFVKLITSIFGSSLLICLGFYWTDTAFFSLYSLAGMACLVLTTIYYVFHPDERNIFTIGLFILINILVMIFISNQSSIFLFNFYLMTGILGVTNFMMVLGHYYLVVPRLSVLPLIYGHYLLWPQLLFKVTLLFYFAYKNFPLFELGTMEGEGGMFNILLVGMRALWGYLALGILSFFSYRLCRMRSTQSATGVLYVMVFFVLVGELIGAYLFFKHGWIV